jgi:hypothetical protein
MKAAKIVLVLLVISALIGVVRSGRGLGHIGRVLPFCSGGEPGLYDFGALAVIAIALWGIARMYRAGKDTDDEPEPSSDAEEVEVDSGEDVSSDSADEDQNDDANSTP